MTWIETIQSNLKWSFTLMIRTLAICTTIALILFLIKTTNVIKWIKDAVVEPVVEGVSEEVISAPDISYTDDSKDIDAVLKLLQTKKP